MSNIFSSEGNIHSNNKHCREKSYFSRWSDSIKVEMKWFPCSNTLLEPQINILIPYWRAEVDSDFHPSEIHKIMPAGTVRTVGTVVRARMAQVQSTDSTSTFSSFQNFQFLEFVDSLLFSKWFFSGALVFPCHQKWKSDWWTPHQLVEQLCPAKSTSHT